MNDKKHPELGKPDAIKRRPRVCGDETAAVGPFASKSALFLMHRIRFALTEDQANRQKPGNTSGICEVDEAFVGGKPRSGDSRTALPGCRMSSNKVPAVAVMERGGHVRTKVVPPGDAEQCGPFSF